VVLGFLGTYEHTLDAKGRLVMPRKFRDQLQEAFVITKGQEDCLYVWPSDAWDREYARVSSLPTTDRRARKFARSFFAGAVDVQLDKQGRIQIPEKLRKFAGIAKDTTVVGAGQRIEVWATDVWLSEEAQADEYYSGIEEVLGLSGDAI
jgi:MraZ protein